MIWQHHEVLKPPSDEEISGMEPEELIRVFNAYHQAIRNAEEDPLRYGWQLEHWKRADRLFEKRDEVMVLGGNRSGKSVYGARSVVKAAIENPGATIMCFAQNAETSVRQLQGVVYDWLPREFRLKTRDTETYLSYSRKNGFTGGSFILPNGSQVIFKHYSQFLQNASILEGAELGSRNASWINIGAWCDEYLIGPELLNTLRFRLATRNAKLLVTFTPIDGYTEVVRDYLEGAETIEWAKAELLENEKVPKVQESRNRDANIVYFHSKENPFGGYSRLSKDLQSRSKKEILTRAYGVPVKAARTLFPMFSRAVNVVKPQDIPKNDVTRYMVIDPAGSKNWFCVWIAVDAKGTFWVYREWPDISIGDWAEWRGGKWAMGPGASGLGYGIVDYVELFAHVEGSEEIFERIIDPRLGSATYQKEFGATSIIQELADHNCVCTPAPALGIDDGIQAMQSKMAFNDEKEIDGTNHPHFYISEDCENTISAILEYTGEGGKDEPAKDPIDCLRYAAISAIDHVPQGALVATVTGSGGY